ncbi:TetR/AcrR family transcriptional regulator [Nocardia salmonicida]|uniref:TetR/AcrR family transcriptional regulator n=1 Tax=Nocardia salmonicida TaxID=53431 RepID=UPI0033CE6B28
MPSSHTAVRRRPKDRKAQIVGAARALFAEHGYPNVTMAQIADQVDITAGGLYRHFANKSVLLSTIIEIGFEEMTPTFDPELSLAQTLAEAAELAVAHPDAGGLWLRESRHLPEEMRAGLQKRLVRVNKRYAGLIQIERPELTFAGAEQLAWGVQSILASPSSHSTRLAMPEFAMLLSGACQALCAVAVSTPRPVTEREPTLRPVSKRESLLGHATVLFGQNGYDATGLDDIGAAAGVTGPNLYSYFGSKADILQAVLDRGDSALWLLLHAVLHDNDDPRAAITALVHGYVELAINGTIFTSLLQSGQVKSADLSGRQREYVAEWTALLRAARPELNDVTARVRVHTALAVANTLANASYYLWRNGAFAGDLAAMTDAVLFDS